MKKKIYLKFKFCISKTSSNIFKYFRVQWILSEIFLFKIYFIFFNLNRDLIYETLFHSKLHILWCYLSDAKHFRWFKDFNRISIVQYYYYKYIYYYKIFFHLNLKFQCRISLYKIIFLNEFLKNKNYCWRVKEKNCCFFSYLNRYSNLFFELILIQLNYQFDA
jgi:hypothetical protein